MYLDNLGLRPCALLRSFTLFAHVARSPLRAHAPFYAIVSLRSYAPLWVYKGAAEELGKGAAEELGKGAAEELLRRARKKI